MTPTPPDKDELREWIKSKIDPKTGMIAVNYAELVERIERYAAERERQARIDENKYWLLWLKEPRGGGVVDFDIRNRLAQLNPVQNNKEETDE